MKQPFTRLTEKERLARLREEVLEATELLHRRVMEEMDWCKEHKEEEVRGLAGVLQDSVDDMMKSIKGSIARSRL